MWLASASNLKSRASSQKEKWGSKCLIYTTAPSQTTKRRSLCRLSQGNCPLRGNLGEMLAEKNISSSSLLLRLITLWNKKNLFNYEWKKKSWLPQMSLCRGNQIVPQTLMHFTETYCITIRVVNAIHDAVCDRTSRSFNSRVTQTHRPGLYCTSTLSASRRV